MSTKLVIFLALMLVRFGFLFSCHGQKAYDPFEIPSEFDTSKQYEIVFWAKNEKNIKQTTVYKEAIAKFEELYPNIKVKMVVYSDYSIIYQDVITNIPTRTTPNVCISYPDHIATYNTGTNIIVPLDELLDDEKFGLGGSEIRFDAPTSGEIVPQFLSEGRINGVQYALPFMRSTEALYYNKDYVKEVASWLGYDAIPEVITWDFVWEISEAALAKNEDGTYYSESSLFPGVIGICNEKDLKYLEYDLIDWLDPYVYQQYITNISHLSVEGDGVSAEFDLSHSLDDKGQETVLSVEYGGKKFDTGNVENFRQYYKGILALSIVDYYSNDEYCTKTEEEMQALMADEDNAMMTVRYKTRDGEESVLRFYRYSTRHCVVTVNGVGEFYLSCDLVDKVLSDTAKVITGEKVIANAKY